MAPITHIVLFHFKPEATAAERKKVRGYILCYLNGD